MVLIGPFPSITFPKASRTLPHNSSPIGTSIQKMLEIFNTNMKIAIILKIYNLFFFIDLV